MTMAFLTAEVLQEQGLVAGVAGVLTVFILLYVWGSRKTHPNEPTVVAPIVPFIGHLLSMAAEGGKYVKKLG